MRIGWQQFFGMQGYLAHQRGTIGDDGNTIDKGLRCAADDGVAAQVAQQVAVIALPTGVIPAGEDQPHTK